MFKDLTLQNFRGFENLQLKGLRPVNLIVGRNNSGKTSLLEGIAIVANPQRIPNMPGLLRSQEGDVMQHYFRWLVRDGSAEAARLNASTETGIRHAFFRGNVKTQSQVPTGFQHVWGQEPFGLSVPQNQAVLNCRIVSVQPRIPADVVKLFAIAVTRRGGEEQMDTLFRQVDDRIRKVRVIPLQDGSHVMFDLNLSAMLPLSQLGQGIDRLITIFSELIAEDSDICIIDEIENGIHHSMLEQVWTGIGAASQSLKVQVFATTHSWECIQAAHAAFAKFEAYPFSIIQLFRVEGAVQGRVLDRKHIEAALAGEIDLR